MMLRCFLFSNLCELTLPFVIHMTRRERGKYRLQSTIEEQKRKKNKNKSRTVDVFFEILNIDHLCTNLKYKMASSPSKNTCKSEKFPAQREKKKIFKVFNYFNKENNPFRIHIVCKQRCHRWCLVF